MVMFSTDNGAACNSWPDGGNHPFRGEKGVGGYEGGFRVPMIVKWPGVIPDIDDLVQSLSERSTR